jgi:predicted dienelactone hydrolase
MNRAIALLGCVAISSVVIQSQTASNPSGTASSSAQTVVAPHSPAPSGTFGIGRTGYDWTDNSRPDRYSTDQQAHRELMVYVWYPTSQKDAKTKGTYLPYAKEMDAVPDIQHSMQQEFEGNWPLIVSGSITSHVRDGAPIANNPRRFPVVLLSHGSGGTTFEYTSLIEDLVSHGYVVAAIEHTYTAIAVAFPNGKIVPFHQDSIPANLSPEQRFQRMMSEASLGIDEGAADIRFVLDKLTELNSGDPQDFLLARRLDVNNVAAIGHSAGGVFATRACELDGRFKACVDLDGAMMPVAALPVGPDGKTMQQPLLFLEAYHPESRMGGTHAQIEEYFKKKEQQLQSCPAGSYNVILKSAGIVHGSFSDYSLLVAGGDTNATAMALHNIYLTQIFTRAFLDKYLKHEKGPLFEGKEYLAEATVQQYGH